MIQQILFQLEKKDSANLSLMFSGIKQIYKATDDIKAWIYFYDYEMVCAQQIPNGKKLF